MADLLAGNFDFVGRLAQGAVEQLRRHPIAIDRIGAHFSVVETILFLSARISPGPRRSPSSTADTAPGNPGSSGEISLRKITKLAKSLSSLPSTYSVGRLQVSATPSAADLAAKLVIDFGVANSGARGSPFLPHALRRQHQHQRQQLSVVSSKPSILSAGARHCFAPCRPAHAGARPPTPAKDSYKCPFRSYWKILAAPPATTLRCACRRQCNAARPCPPPHGPARNGMPRSTK